jgi:hypothetical protein
MGLIEFVIIAVILGLAVYLINTLLPIPPPIKTILTVVVVVVLVVLLLRAMVGDIPIPRLR